MTRKDKTTARQDQDNHKTRHAHLKTRQDKTRQVKTKQGKARQGKTRKDKTTTRQQNRDKMVRVNV